MEKRIDRVLAVHDKNSRRPEHANRMIVPAEDFDAISPFIVLVEDWFRRPAGFPTHPHRGIQTVTFVLDGALEHRDHTGGHGVLRQGDVQWMTAGHGVMHSELPHEGEQAHTLQLWLNLPGRQKMMMPRYVNQLGADVPVAKPADGAEVRVYAGQVGEMKQQAGSDWPMTLLDIRAEPGARFTLNIPAADRGFVLTLEGQAKIGGAQVGAGTVAWYEPGGDTLAVAAETHYRGLLYSSRPIDEPVVAYGPFVMNSEAEIHQAYEDYRTGRFIA